MFFTTPPAEILKVKIAPYAKLPYVRDNRSYCHRSGYEHYHEIHNMMYRVVCTSSKTRETYFYSKNNIIYYRRKSNSGVELFALDYVSGTYKLVRFRKLDIKLDDKNTILVKTEKGKWYVITALKEHSSSTEYLLIIDALNGVYLYKEEIVGDDNMYVDILYPIANRIVPIMHFTRKSVYVRLFDTENEGFHTAITFNIEDIDRLAKLIMNKAKGFSESEDRPTHHEQDSLTQYNIDYIEDIKITSFEYQHETNDKNPVYVKAARFKFNLTIKYNRKEMKYNNYTCELFNIFCYIELDKETVNCYLDFSEVTLIWDDRLFGEYSAVDNKMEPVIYKYYLSGGFGDIYLSRCLYKDHCYYIYNTPDGVAIVKANKSDYIELKSKQAALYRYGRYHIIFLYNSNITLIVIDLESRKIGCWTCKNPDIQTQIHYEQYYSKSQNKLIFVSKNLEYLLIIDIDKLGLAFSSNKNLECIGNCDNESNNENTSCSILCYFNIKPLISKVIVRERGLNIQHEDIRLIRHYYDTDLDVLYIVANYAANGINHIQVFSLRISCNPSTVRSVHYMSTDLFYGNAYYRLFSLLYSGLTHKVYNKLGLSKIFIHGYNENILRSLDIAYNEDTRCLVDIRYNRNSLTDSTVEYGLEQSVYNYRDFIAVNYTLTYDFNDDLSILFIKSELSLVRRMTAIQMRTA